jgi:hypothetical protein
VSLAPRSVLLIVAVILFLLAAFNVALGTISLVPLGLAAVAAAFLVGDGGLNLRRGL